MRRNWYFNMLMSYLPIFLIVTFFLLFLYFYSLSDRNEKQIVETHKLIGLKIIQLVDSNLLAINETFSRETVYNDVWKSFLTNDDNNEFNKYNAFVRIHEAMASNPLIESIYLVNLKDQIVLGNSKPYTLSEFEQFFQLDQRKLASNKSSWSNIYTFLKAKSGHNQELSRNEDDQNPNVSKRKDQEHERVRIITLTKTVGLRPKDGLLLVSVDIDKLQETIDRAYNPELIKVRVFNDEGTEILGASNEEHNKEKMVVELASPVTGWTFQIGYSPGWLFNSPSVLSHMDLLIAIAAVIIGAVVIILVTRRHYRPVQQIMSRIFNSPADGWADVRKDRDEWKWIQTALETYMDHSRRYEHLYLSEHEQRNRYVIREMLEGSRPFDALIWMAIKERYQLLDNLRVKQCLLMEIDEYSSFNRLYSDKDRELLRFTVKNVATELAGAGGAKLYCDWVSGERLLIVLFMAPSQLQESTFARDLVHSILDWVERNLRFTITAGIGTPATDEEKTVASYQEAKAALSYKMVLGKNRALEYADLTFNPGKELRDLIGMIAQIVSSLLQGKNEWENSLYALLETMRHHLLSRDDIVNLLQYLVYQLQKDVALQNETIAQYWKSECMQPLEAKLQAQETLEDMHQHLLQFIRPLFQQIVDHQKMTKHYVLMHKVKEYIEHNYCDDMLSLEALSSHFQMGDKYLSQLFKDTFGINFGEFVTDLRLKKARELLLQTTDPIQEIGQQVGYANPLTFTRVFKRTLGMTPSELRQRNRQ